MNTDDCLRGGLSTKSLAQAIDGKATSIRVRLCQTGSYYGIQPKKLPSGRLLWPSDSVERLLGESKRRNLRPAENLTVEGVK